MLQELLTVPIAAMQLYSGQAELPKPTSYNPSNHNAQYKVMQADCAEYSETLTARLLKEANALAKKHPISAIPLYRRVIAESDSGQETDKEKAIKSLGDIFTNLIYKKYDRWIIESALNFFDEVIQNHSNSNYLSEAYRKSGLIYLTEIDPKDVSEGIRRLKVAYELADKNGDATTKINSAWNIGSIGLEYAIVNDPAITLKEVKFFLGQAAELEPESIISEAAKSLLNKIESITK